MAEQTVCAPVARNHCIRPMRMGKLTRILRRVFGCEIRRGKGSEVKIYRRGAKPFLLSSHGRNVTVPAERVAALLKRLGIGPQEWRQAAYA